MKAFFPLVASCVLGGFGSALSQEKSAPEIQVIEILYQSKVAKQVTEPHEAVVKDLRSKYSAALLRSQEASQNDGKLEQAIAFKTERELIESGGDVPSTDVGTVPESLKKFRETYRSASAKLEQERKAKLQVLAAAHARELTDLSVMLTKAGKLDEAQTAKQKAEALAKDALAAVPPPVVDTRAADSFARQIAGTEWKWNGGSNILTFGKDGKTLMLDWDKKGLVTDWKVVEPGKVELLITSGRTKNLNATLVFAANRKSFTGTDFDGKPLNESPKVR